MEFEIKNTRDAHTDGVKILLFGASGLGKTTMLGTLSGKTLILSAESGLLVLRDKDVDVIDIDSVEKLGAIYIALKNGELKYDNVCLDSLSEIGEMIVKELDADDYYGDPSNTFPMWKEYSKKMISIAKSFRDLKGINIVLTALAEPVEANGSIKYLPMIPAKKAQAKLVSLFDEVYYYSFNKDKQRVLHTSGSNMYEAKSRIGLNSDIVVEEDVSLGSIIDTLNK